MLKVEFCLRYPNTISDDAGSTGACISDDADDTKDKVSQREITWSVNKSLGTSAKVEENPVKVLWFYKSWQ